MIQKINNFLNKFKKPSIKIIFKDKGLTIHYTNMTPSKYYSGLFYLLQKSSNNLGIPFRELINKLVDVDKQIIKDQKLKDKTLKYGSKDNINNRH